MAKKNNIHSIRFSDEIIEMIESQAGETFTAKFEALVTRCMWELPKKEKELEYIQMQITQRRQQLSKLSQKINDMQRIMNNAQYNMESFERAMKTAVQSAERLCNTE